MELLLPTLYSTRVQNVPTVLKTLVPKNAPISILSKSGRGYTGSHIGRSSFSPLIYHNAGTIYTRDNNGTDKHVFNLAARLVALYAKNMDRRRRTDWARNVLTIPWDQSES